MGVRVDTEHKVKFFLVVKNFEIHCNGNILLKIPLKTFQVNILRSW